MVNSSENWQLLKWFSVGFFCLSCWYSFDIYQQASLRIEAQRNINKNVSQVKQTWAALQPTMERWNSVYLSHDEVKDLVTLEKHLNIANDALFPAGNTLIEGSSRSVFFEGIDIGLAERCIRNSSDGYQLSTNKLSAAVAGMSLIDKRIGLNWKKVVITSKNNRFLVTYSELCNHYRIGSV